MARTDLPGAPLAPPRIAGKAWATFKARAALSGLALVRTHPEDGPVRLLVCRAGQWRELRTIEDMEALIVSTATVGR